MIISKLLNDTGTDPPGTDDKVTKKKLSARPVEIPVFLYPSYIGLTL